MKYLTAIAIVLLTTTVAQAFEFEEALYDNCDKQGYTMEGLRCVGVTIDIRKARRKQREAEAMARRAVRPEDKAMYEAQAKAYEAAAAAKLSEWKRRFGN